MEELFSEITPIRCKSKTCDYKHTKVYSPIP